MSDEAEARLGAAAELDDDVLLHEPVVPGLSRDLLDVVDHLDLEHEFAVLFLGLLDVGRAPVVVLPLDVRSTEVDPGLAVGVDVVDFEAVEHPFASREPCRAVRHLLVVER